MAAPNLIADIDSALPPPAPGETAEVAPGVHWLRMPLPFRLNHINLWLLQDGDGWTIIDTGVKSDKSKSIWRTIIQNLSGTENLNRLICTHAHPDHMGLAGWFCEEFGMSFFASRGEWEAGRKICQSNSTPPEVYYEFYAKLDGPRRISGPPCGRSWKRAARWARASGGWATASACS